MIQAAFGECSPWSVGVEEELMILDAETLELVPRSDVFVREAERRGLAGRLKTELFASIVELNTPVCATAAEALESLRELRRVAGEIATAHGLAVAAAGSHPISRAEDQEIAPDPRYEAFVEYAGVTARRQGVNGLHVHVGMPSGPACYHALEGVLPWLPLVLALSVNSPYFEGRETGHSSKRAELLAELPRSGAPPLLGSYAGWEEYVARFVRLGLATDETTQWWDVRPSRRFGTLEVRMPDQPTAIELSGAFAALTQALCATVLRLPQRPPDASGRGIYQQNRWAALHRGPRAELVHPDEDRLVPVPELAEELLELVRPALRELDAEGLVTPLDPEGCEADRQLQIGRAEGLRALCSALVAGTLGSR